MGAPQLTQFTIWIFWLKSAISWADSVWMKLFSRKKSRKPMNRPCSLHRQ
jgi:hypothetical protein